MRRRGGLSGNAGRGREEQRATQQYGERTKQSRTTLPNEELANSALHYKQPEPSHWSSSSEDTLYYSAVLELSRSTSTGSFWAVVSDFRTPVRLGLPRSDSGLSP